MGGRTPEHEISLLSGRTVLGALDRGRYRGRGVVIGRDGLWSLFGEDEVVPSGPGAYAGGCHAEAAAGALREWGVDAVFPALHGPFGEDGSIQGFLKILDIPCVGSGVRASALALDKPLSKALLAGTGILTAPHAVLGRDDWNAAREKAESEILKAIGLPCFVKAVRLGSSVGVRRVDRRDDFPGALAAVFEEDGEIMAERFIPGREISCAVLGNAGGELRSLPPVEIRLAGAIFFDYRAKYEPGGAEEICPAPIDDDLTDGIRRAAERVHTLIGARGFSRSDFIVNDDGIWFLELNSIPGLTPQSILPKAAAAGGIDLDEMITLIVETAFEPSGETRQRKLKDEGRGGLGAESRECGE
jgi:D-alanine-D-alanine ligase